jgi:threonine dehydrogenase-like Zn-dependent dehydrogenase
MRALTLQGQRFRIEQLPEPIPTEGQILVAPIFNGICGSDLHQRAAMRAEESLSSDPASLPKMVLGHEFCGEVVEVAPGTTTDLRRGDRVVGLPFTLGPDPLSLLTIGLTVERSGGLADLSRLDAVRSFRVPDSVSSDLASLTEPLAVGRHAIGLANRFAGPNIILGCGPIGLAVLLALRDEGRGPIIAADFSKERREMAAMLGADIVIDPAERSPYTAWAEVGFAPDPVSPLLEREFAGTPRGLNIFECTGAPSVLREITENAPLHSHVIYVGVCMHEAPHVPVNGVIRELTIEYSFAYTPQEFLQSLQMIERRPELVAKMVTKRVPLTETEAAFDRLATSPSEVKVLVDVRA